MHSNMRIISAIDWCHNLVSFIAASLGVLLVYTVDREVPGCILNLRPGLKWTFFIVPHIVLLAILKYRAAHHRKIRKFQDHGHSVNGTDNDDSILRTYLREIFYCEAKMSLIRSSHLHENWHLICSFTVWVLFPRQIALVYVMTAWVSMIIQMIMVVGYLHCFTDAESLVYNGRRYAICNREVYYSLIQDEEGKIVYYPNADLRGLIQPKGESGARQ
ncbi:hypothetical protein PSACC_01406 [Paramicrosporidium saccamoebae]|uniref:Uncharacterized protein n=1 Tax=Paramicrosporidium saccamoebae TaxID=1246581 RepID=A0A2H9TM39_9FUNG|nr:hypothetical protein PSACC_01406 [Paramicrosporidium saccamoebae]